MKRLTTLALLLLALTAPAQELTHRTYKATDAIIENPERGFFTQPQLGLSSGYGAKTYSSANGMRLIRLVVYLDAFVESDISNTALTNLQKNFDNIRKAGLKCVLRFAYFNDENQSASPHEASPEQTYRHLEQLTPLMRQNADIIAVLESGIVGKWGEWHTNSVFKTAAEQQELVHRLLEMMPADRCVTMRTPAQAKTALGLSGFGQYVTRTTAFNGTPLSRLGGYNDGLLGSTGDLGTYSVGGDDARAFWEKQSLFTPMGGETGGPGDNTYSSCIEPDYAAQRLSSQHYTYLNSGWYNGTLDAWRSNGFYDTLQRRLGYRLVLLSSDMSSTLAAGQAFTVRLQLTNEGYAAPINPRPVQLVVATADGKEQFRADFNTDVRFWLPGEVQPLEQTFTLPANLPEADYHVDLDLPDAAETLKGRPEYSIRLANDGTWDATTGRNHLAYFPADGNYSDLYRSDILPWVRKPGELFYLKRELLEPYDLQALETFCDIHTYNALKALVDNPTESLVFPEGYFRLKSGNRYAAYPLTAGLSTSQQHLAPVSGKGLDANLSTVFKVERQADGSVTLQTEGQYLCGTTVADGSTDYCTLTPTPTRLHFVVSASHPGQCAIWLNSTDPSTLSDALSRQAFLLASQTIGTSSAREAWWTFEKAEGGDVSISLTPVADKAFASLCAPFPIAFTDGAEAFAVSEIRATDAEPAAVLRRVTGVVPAGTPLLLVGPEASATAYGRIGSDAEAGSPAAWNLLAGSFLPLTRVGHSRDLSLDLSASPASFRRRTERYLEANTAYLPSAAADAAETVALIFADEATAVATPCQAQSGPAAYDLQGRRVAASLPRRAANLPKGIYVANGQKLIIR